MLRTCGCNNRTDHIGTAHLKTYRDDLDALVRQFAAQCLPPGQVVAAASIGRPRGDDHLLPS